MDAIFLYLDFEFSFPKEIGHWTIQMFMRDQNVHSHAAATLKFPHLINRHTESFRNFDEIACERFISLKRILFRSRHNQKSTYERCHYGCMLIVRLPS